MEEPTIKDIYNLMQDIKKERHEERNKWEGEIAEKLECLKKSLNEIKGKFEKHEEMNGFKKEINNKFISDVEKQQIDCKRKFEDIGKAIGELPLLKWLVTIAIILQIFLKFFSDGGW